MEQKKLLLVIISVGVFLVLVIGAGMLVFAPKAKPVAALQMKAPAPDASKPASVDPSEWLKDPSAVSTLAQPAPGTSTRGDVIVIYGERPSVVNGVDTSITPGTTPPSAPNAQSSVPTVAPDGNVQVDVTPQGGAPQNASQGGASVTVRAAPAIPPAAKAPQQAAPRKERAPEAKTQRTASSVTKNGDEFWIQTGSFADKGRADSAKETLSAKGIASLVETKDLSGKTFFRVRVGPYTTKKEADYWLSLVKTIEGFNGSYVSQVKAKR